MFVSVEDARAHLHALLPTRPHETLPLQAALGRTLADSVMARVSHPGADNSALDGVACREADTRAATTGTPVRLRVVGESRAGAAHAGTVGPGECVRIYTGATLPAGADAICPVEQLVDDGPHHVLLRRPARKEDVRRAGEDFQSGQTVLPAGARLTPSRLALAAAAGHAELPVWRPWRVGLLSTGDEIIAPGQPLQAGQVYDSNSAGLHALLREDGCEVLPLGHAPDSPEALSAVLEGTGGVDLLLSSGGVSMGRYDFLRDLLIERGQVSFWKIRMRPGGPALLGTWNGLPVLGLPGNPVSSLVVYSVVARPVLTGGPLRTVRLRAATAFRSLPDRAAYWRGVVGQGAEAGQVRDVGAQGSGMLRALSDADALVVVPEGQSVNVGDEVEVILL